MDSKSKEVNQLNENLTKLNKNLDRQNSLIRNFIISIFRGVGYFIGVTIVASIIVFILSQTIKSIVDISLLEDVVGPNIIEEIELNHSAP